MSCLALVCAQAQSTSSRTRLLPAAGGDAQHPPRGRLAVEVLPTPGGPMKHRMGPRRSHGHVLDDVRFLRRPEAVPIERRTWLTSNLSRQLLPRMSTTRTRRAATSRSSSRTSRTTACPTDRDHRRRVAQRCAAEDWIRAREGSSGPVTVWEHVRGRVRDRRTSPVLRRGRCVSRAITSVVALGPRGGRGPSGSCSAIVRPCDGVACGGEPRDHRLRRSSRLHPPCAARGGLTSEGFSPRARPCGRSVEGRASHSSTVVPHDTDGTCAATRALQSSPR